MNDPIQCGSSGRKDGLKAGVCVLLALILIPCRSLQTNLQGKAVHARSGQERHESRPPAAVSRKGVRFRNTGPGVEYVGSEACAPCHRKIYNEYMRTPHGQAASLPDQRPELRDLPAEGVSICEKEPAHCFRVFRENSSYYMSEYEPGPNGTDLNKQTERVAYALGQPMTGVGYVIQRGDYLFEAPLSYYAGSQDKYPQGWGISPGYEKDPLGFARPLVGSCMYCHVGRLRPTDDASNLYKSPPFGELTVGCESCHGPGALHVVEQKKHKQILGKIDTSIVNTAHVSSRLADETCIYCHEFGEARIPQPGKSFVDYRPGTPLLDTMAIFKSRLLMGWNMMEWSDEMALSKCYRASGGRINCFTCHDPHMTPSAQKAPLFYREKCLKCHKESSCRAPLEKRRTTDPADNCVTCHMPKHTAPRFVMLGTTGTSHRIVATEDQPLPPLTTPQTSPDPATGLILVNSNPDSRYKEIDPTVLLQAYQSVLLRNSNRLDLRDRYNQLLDQLAQSAPENVTVLSALAKRELEKHLPKADSSAMAYLTKAVELGSNSPQDYMLLSELLYRSGRKAESIRILNKAVSLFPYIPTPFENLGYCYLSVGDYAHAKEIVNTGLRVYPNDPNLRGLEKKLDTAP